MDQESLHCNLLTLRYENISNMLCMRVEKHKANTCKSFHSKKTTKQIVKTLKFKFIGYHASVLPVQPTQDDTGLFVAPELK